MKTFKQILELYSDKEREMKNATLSPLFFNIKIGDILVKPSIHAASQAEERRPDLNKNDWTKIHNKSVEYLTKNKFKTGDYVIFSKSYQQGYVVDYSVQNKLMKIVTCLPKGKSTPKEGTRKLMVEGYGELELIIID